MCITKGVVICESRSFMFWRSVTCCAGTCIYIRVRQTQPVQEGESCFADGMTMAAVEEGCFSVDY